MGSCFSKKKQNDVGRYIYQHKNSFQLIGKLEDNYKDPWMLDTDHMHIWMCDRNMKIVQGSFDPTNNLDAKKYIGKRIFDVQPQDFGQYCGYLHQKCQTTNEVTRINLLVNEKIVHIIVLPVTYENTVIASSLIIIPYTTKLTQQG